MGVRLQASKPSFTGIANGCTTHFALLPNKGIFGSLLISVELIHFSDKPTARFIISNLLAFLLGTISALVALILFV